MTETFLLFFYNIISQPQFPFWQKCTYIRFCRYVDRNTDRNTTINDVPLPYRHDPDDEVALSDGRIVVALRTFRRLPRKQSDLRNSYSPSEPFDVLPIPGSASTFISNKVVILGILFCIIVPITSVEVQQKEIEKNRRIPRHLLTRDGILILRIDPTTQHQSTALQLDTTAR